MEYKLVKSSNNDIEILIKYKKQTIYKYAKELSEEEINKIDTYILNSVPKLINNYFNVFVNNKIVGCVLLRDIEYGKLLDEIYLEEEYRNKGIGTDIINNILKNNKIVYLWVDKENLQAISLYKRLGFNVINETDLRYYMKYVK